MADENQDGAVVDNDSTADDTGSSDNSADSGNADQNAGGSAYQRSREDNDLIARLERERDEAVQNGRAWYEIATSQQKADESDVGNKAAAKPAVTKEELVAAIVEGGSDGFVGILDRLGYVTASKAEELAERRVKDQLDPLLAMAELAGEYPELANVRSEFYQQASAKYQELLKDEFYKVSKRQAMRRAAELTELENFRATARTNAGTANRASNDADRAARIGAQSGSTGKRAAANANTGQLKLNDRQRAAAAKYGVTDDQMIARVKLQQEQRGAA